MALVRGLGLGVPGFGWTDIRGAKQALGQAFIPNSDISLSLSIIQEKQSLVDENQALSIILHLPSSSFSYAQKLQYWIRVTICRSRKQPNINAQACIMVYMSI